MAKLLDDIATFFGRAPEDDLEEYDEYEEFVEDDDYFDDSRDYREEEPRRSPLNFGFLRNNRGERGRSYERAEERDGYAYNESERSGGTNRIVLKKIKSFAEIKRVADLLIQNHSVILSVADMERKEAQRCIDFLSGVTHAKSGDIASIAKMTYFFAVGPVDIVGRIAELSETERYFFSE